MLPPVHIGIHKPDQTKININEFDLVKSAAQLLYSPIPVYNFFKFFLWFFLVFEDFFRIFGSFFFFVSKTLDRFFRGKTSLKKSEKVMKNLRKI